MLLRQIVVSFLRHYNYLAKSDLRYVLFQIENDTL